MGVQVYLRLAGRTGEVSTQLGMETCWVKWMGRMSGFRLGSVQLAGLQFGTVCSSYTTAALRDTTSV